MYVDLFRGLFHSCAFQRAGNIRGALCVHSAYGETTCRGSMNGAMSTRLIQVFFSLPDHTIVAL